MLTAIDCFSVKSRFIINGNHRFFAVDNKVAIRGNSAPKNLWSLGPICDLYAFLYPGKGAGSRNYAVPEIRVIFCHMDHAIVIMDGVRTCLIQHPRVFHKYIYSSLREPKGGR